MFHYVLIKFFLQCRRVNSADGLSGVSKKGSNSHTNGRLANSTLCLSVEELKLVKMARAQFQRRGGWVRIFPTADSWIRYSQYLDSNTGVPLPAIPHSTHPTVPITHNYNMLLHNHLFADISKGRHFTGSKDRHDRYERQLSQGHRGGNLDPSNDLKLKESADDLKKQIITMLKSGRVLT